MTPEFNDLWRRWFMVDIDGERPAMGPYDSREEAEAMWAEYLEELPEDA